MGWRYIGFRVQNEIMKRTGLLKNKFPASPAYHQYVTLDQWKRQPAAFFFTGRSAIQLPRNPAGVLKETFNDINNGRLLLLNSVLTDLGKDYDWVTNPDSGFHYDTGRHWTQIPDYSKEAGDIKYVWEKSRFSYLYDIVRYDYHHSQDCATLVFHDILSWINGNPVNCGPNYRCSQEMSLRVLNWTFALYYYRDSPALTEEIFNQVQHTIYWHMHHVYNNIDFSRIAVRNNHAITETLTLYLAGIFYPAMPGADVWKKKGKTWFEEEIAYQVYEDGTFLQFSMNYHRIVAQLLTWGIALAEKNGERFSDVVYDRARKTFQFLRTCMVEENGWLPNYGANDGALFFKLSDTHYRDYRPQLQALGSVLGIDAGFEAVTEDDKWYGISKPGNEPWQPHNGVHSFDTGGFYIIREAHTLTFLRCGNHKDRPQQADNLHLDIWYKGENILLDAGSYKYNTDAATIRYFSGTQSHNTVMVSGHDQMLKGGHFIWFFWTQRKEATLTEDAGSYVFNGTIHAFTYLNNGILHTRTMIKKKDRPEWTIRDEIAHIPRGMTLQQLWHMPRLLKSKVALSSKDTAGAKLLPTIEDGWYSSLYGQKERTETLRYTSDGPVIETRIAVAE